MAIVRAVSLSATRIIFDEPTAALEHGISQVHSLIRGLRDDGITVIFISHNFEEVMGLADLVWVMRHGKAVTSRRASDTTGLEHDAIRDRRCRWLLTTRTHAARPTRGAENS